MAEWKGGQPCKWTSYRKHLDPPGIKGEGVKEKIFSGTFRPHNVSR